MKHFHNSTSAFTFSFSVQICGSLAAGRSEAVRMTIGVPEGILLGEEKALYVYVHDHA